MSILTTLLYQPFFNLLIFYYYLLDQIPGIKPDMGVAVIFLTLTIRLLLLPLTIASTRTKKERRAVEDSIANIKEELKHQPTHQKEAVRKTFHTNKRIVISEGVNFLIQLMIFFILYHIFTTGLLGADFHLVYDFMPTIQLPFNLLFLNKYDLTHTNFTLNFLQSLSIIALESINLIDSPYPITRTDFVRYVIILPLASFIIFMFLPAGKKLFVITTLWFSFFYTLLRILQRQLQKFMGRWENLGVNTSSESTPQS